MLSLSSRWELKLAELPSGYESPLAVVQTQCLTGHILQAVDQLLCSPCPSVAFAQLFGLDSVVFIRLDPVQTGVSISFQVYVT